MRWEEVHHFVHPLACFPSSVSQKVGAFLCDRAWSEAQWDLSNVFAFGSWICYSRCSVRAMPYSDFFTIRWELSHFNTQCHVQVSLLTPPLSRSTSRFMSPISEARLNQAHSGVKESPSPHKHQGEPGCLDWVPNFLTAPSESISGFYMGQYSSSCPLYI